MTVAIRLTKSLLSVVAIVCSFTILCCTSTQAAHPFHISWTEMEWNGGRQVFEVSIKAHSIDIERALTRSKQKKIDLEKTDRSAELVTEYLSQHFYLALKSDAPKEKASQQADSSKPDNKKADEKLSTINLIGTEFEASWIWFYFELKPTKPLSEDVALVNSILLDEVDKQINTITVRFGKEKSADRTSIKKPFLMLEKRWYASK